MSFRTIKDVTVNINATFPVYGDGLMGEDPHGSLEDFLKNEFNIGWMLGEGRAGDPVPDHTGEHLAGGLGGGQVTDVPADFDVLFAVREGKLVGTFVQRVGGV